MWTIAGGIVLGVVLLFLGLVAISLIVNFFRWISDLGDDMRNKKIAAHNALLAKHGLSPSHLTSEQLAARYRGKWIDPKDVKPMRR
jgi:hypothetical protein